MNAGILYNPGAGDEQLEKKELLSMITGAGINCSFLATDEKLLHDMHYDVDFIIAAGGDGTVEKAATEMLMRNNGHKKVPIAVLPLGTANNIAQTLGVYGTTEEIIHSWRHPAIQKFDAGLVEGIHYFYESFGYGIFSFVMQHAAAEKIGLEKPRDEKLQLALEELYETIASYEGVNCNIEVDDQFITGKFLMIEVMNIRSIGPNLCLSQDSNPGDGIMEVILFGTDDRKRLSNYVEDKLNGVENQYAFRTLSGKNIRLIWDGSRCHADDELITINKNSDISIQVCRGALEFFRPE